MKKILAIYYSQSGQMIEIIDALTAPLSNSDCTVEKVRVYPTKPYAFPWTGSRFFSVMPDSVLGKPTTLDPFQIKEKVYDLVILGYQPWFLSPSIPSSSILQDPSVMAVLKNAPVVTISAARNMWLTAFDGIRKLLYQAGARLVGNIALIDRHSNPVSFATIFYWMLTGKKERYLNILPKPGVDEKDIRGSEHFGSILLPYLKSGNWDGLQQELVDQKAVKISYPLMTIERKARYIFKAWAKFISRRKNKAPWISVFKYYLFFALFVGAPILLILDAILVRPFTQKKIKRETRHYLLLN